MKDGGLDSDSAEDTKVDYLAIARLIFSTLDKTDPIKKKYWNDIIDKLQRLALIKQIRPLNPDEETLEVGLFNTISKERSTVKQLRWD